MSAVVLQEITAGATDDGEVRSWNAARRDHETAGTLLIPNGEDWWMVGKVLNSLLRGLKPKNRGRVPKLSIEEIQRITRDVLIPGTAKRAGAAIVTDNIRDFEKIKTYCNVRLIKPREYFGIS